MISDNIVADFIERNGNTISFINYRVIDLTNSIFVDKLSTLDNETGVESMKFLIDLRKDGLEDIVSNNGFHHWWYVGVFWSYTWYYTTDDCVYSYNILLLLSTVSSVYLAPLAYNNGGGVWGGVMIRLAILVFSPLVDYLSPKYYKQFNKNNINIKFNFSCRKQFVFRLAISVITGRLSSKKK